MNNIEAYSFGKRAALADGYNISNIAFKGRGTVDGDVTVTFFVTSIFSNVVEVITTDNNSALHLGRDNKTLEDTTTNGYVTSERTFFINVVTINGSLGCFESKSDGSVVTRGTSLH